MQSYLKRTVKTETKPVKKLFEVGDKVELLKDHEPYYSDYGGNPKVIVHKGTIGTVMVVNAPSVCREGVYFNCVDFVLEGIYSGNPIYKNNVWRCAVKNKDMRKV